MVRIVRTAAAERSEQEVRRPRPQLCHVQRGGDHDETVASAGGHQENHGYASVC